MVYGRSVVRTLYVLMIVVMGLFWGCTDDDRPPNNIKNNFNPNNTNNITNNENNKNNENNTNNISGNRKTWGDYVEVAARAICTKRYACCDTATIESIQGGDLNISYAQCVSREAQRFEARLLRDQGLIQTGRLGLNADAMFACVAQFEALSCQDYSKTPTLDCTSALEPKRELNQSCTINEECKTKNCALFQGFRSCQPEGSRRKQGDACEENAQCQTGLYCDEQLKQCQPKVALDAPCGQDAQCGTGRCDQGKCSMIKESVCMGNGPGDAIKLDDTSLARWRDLLWAVSGIYCDKQEQCCNSTQTYTNLDPKSADSCQEVTQATFISQVYALYDAQTSNRIDTDIVVIDRCKQALISQTCGALESTGTNQRTIIDLLNRTMECQALFKPATNEGARCLDDRACQQGTCFKRDEAAYVGRCALDASDGQACDDKPCDEGLYCNPSNQCAAKRTQLQACDTPGTDVGCAPGFSCQLNVGQCESPKANGQPCMSANACESQRCEQNTCVAKSNEGQRCQFDTDCLDSWCDASNTCRAKKVDGTSCINNQECQSNLCNGQCYTLKSNTEPCADHTECQSGFCNFTNNVCDVPRPVGAACNTYQACDSQRCDGNLCQPKLGDNQPCQRDRDCEGICTNGTCQPPAKEGETCQQDKSCDTGLLCLDGTCRPTASLGQDCFSDRQCERGTCQITPRCQAKRAKGADCASDDQCATRYCGNSNTCEDLPSRIVCR